MKQLMAMLVPGALGDALGYWIGEHLGRGKDNIFHPALWTTPLGLFAGVVVAATLGSIGRRRRSRKK